jgi:3-oxoacyl-[acyl-carrier protein] reductase
MKKRNVIVTGGSRGIGKAIAFHFALQGDVVAIIGRDETSLANAKEESSLFPGCILPFKGDVSSANEMETIFSTFVRQYGEVNILINNAGINTRDDYSSTNLDLWNKEIGINLTGAFICSQLVIKSMVEQKKGWIVMMSSVKAFEGSRSLSYGASKAGLVSLTKSYARIVSKFGVRVNCVAPSMVETDMARQWSETDKVNYLKKLRVGRFARPEEIASVVAFLCSPEADFLSGAIVKTDGGYFL